MTFFLKRSIYYFAQYCADQGTPVTIQPSRPSSSPTKGPTRPKCERSSQAGVRFRPSLAHFSSFQHPTSDGCRFVSRRVGPVSLPRPSILSQSSQWVRRRTRQVGNFAKMIKVDDAHAPERAANAILSAVLAGVETYGTKSVTAVGHSLGAAISLLDAIFLPLHIPGLTVAYYGYGLPRVRISTGIFLNGKLDHLKCHSHRLEIKISPTTLIVNSTAGSLASPTSKTPFRFSPVDPWASDILLAKPTSTMEKSGSGALVRITLMLSVVLEIPQICSLLTSVTTRVPTMLSTSVVKLISHFIYDTKKPFRPVY